MRSITPAELERLGYTTGAFIRIGKYEHVSSIFELLDEQGRQAGFCYLKVRTEVDGVIMPHPFHYYLGKHEFDLSEYQQPPIEQKK